MEPYIWIQQNGVISEYIYIYVDDLVITSTDPKILIYALEIKYKLNTKVTGPISFILRYDFFHGSNGVLWFSPLKYIDKMVQTYMTMFGKNPKLHNYVRTPL